MFIIRSGVEWQIQHKAKLSTVFATRAGFAFMDSE